jgi:hypothetical protein
VATSTFGIGLGFDEVLLQRIADQGGGNARFIESSADFRRLVDAELRDTLDVVLKGTVLRITVPIDGTVEAIGPWSLRQQGRDWDLSLGDLSSEETLELVLRVFVPGGALGSETTFGLSLFDQTGELEGGAATVSFRREVHAVNIAQPRDREVDQLVAERHAARTRAEAVRLNRQGDFAGAERMLNAVADRIARYAGDNPVLVSLIEALRAEATEHARPMTEVRSKRQWQKSSSELRGKDAEGTSKRRRDCSPGSVQARPGLPGRPGDTGRRPLLAGERRRRWSKTSSAAPTSPKRPPACRSPKRWLACSAARRPPGWSRADQAARPSCAPRALRKASATAAAP